MKKTLTMKKTRILLTVFLAANLSLAGLAQVKVGKISGQVGDESQKPIESATISLLNAKDSSQATATVTDKTGRFELDHIREGKYLVSASTVGHSTTYSSPFELSTSRSSVVLPPLVLQTATKALREVAVIGKKPFIKQKSDRTVINVDASPSKAGSTA